MTLVPEPQRSSTAMLWEEDLCAFFGGQYSRACLIQVKNECSETLFDIKAPVRSMVVTHQLSSIDASLYDNSKLL